MLEDRFIEIFEKISSNKFESFNNEFKEKINNLLFNYIKQHEAYEILFNDHDLSIKIKNNKYSKSFQNGLILLILFEKGGSGFNILLIKNNEEKNLENEKISKCLLAEIKKENNLLIPLECDYLTEIENNISIISKFYNEDNIYEFRSDLPNFIRIYNSLVITYNNITTYRNQIVNNITKIFKKYPQEIKKPFKTSAFKKWVKTEFYNEFRKLLTECVSDSSVYESKITMGKNNWAEFLQIFLFNHKFYNENSENIIIKLRFNHETNEFETGLLINKIDKKLILSRTKFLQKEIKTKFPKLSKKPQFKYNSIIINRLKLDNINYNTLKQNLCEIIKIYEYLMIKFPSFLKNEFFENQDLRKTNTPKIWKLNLSKHKETTIDYWEEFRNNSYITTSFIYEHNNIDYKKFKNKSALENYFSNDQDIGKKLVKSIWRFVNHVIPNDIILIYDERGLRGIGIIDSIFKRINNKTHINNFYYVRWIIILEEDFEFKSGRSKQAFTEISFFSWNKIILSLSYYNKNLLKHISNYIYKQYDDFLKKDNTLIENYDNKMNYINKTWDELCDKKSNNIDISNDIWNKIILKYSKNDVKHTIQDREKFSDEEMKIVANLFFNTINCINNTLDTNKQRNIIEDYVNSKYSSKLKSYRYFVDILHYVNNNFLIINKSMNNLFEGFNLILHTKFKVNKTLIHYIDYNELFHEYLKIFYTHPHLNKFELDNFRNLYIFNKWLTQENWIKDNMLPIKLLNNLEEYCEPELTLEQKIFDLKHENFINNRYIFKKEILEQEDKSLVNILLEIKDRNEEILEKVKETQETTRRIEFKIEGISDKINDIQHSTEKLLESAKTDEEIDLIIETHINKCIDKIEKYNTNIEENNSYELEKIKLIKTMGESAWNKLSDKSKTFLITSKLMYNKLIMNPGIIDYSGVCLLVSKALEVEIYNRFFRGFIDYLDNTYNRDYSKYHTALLFKNTIIKDEKFSMGRIAYILCHYTSKYDTNNQIINNELKLMEYCKLKIFSRYNEDEIKELLNKYASSIEEIRVKYRNPSAHTNEIRESDAEECFNLIIDIKKLLKKMLDSFDE